MMKIGVIYPQTEIGDDPAAIKDYAQTAEGLGYTHILAYDHVLGANPDRPDWKGPYSYETPFHEVFTLFSFLAAVTTRIEFVNGILILPQRQTALVAKQAATLDVLSGGRLRLGVGLGWNWVEYIALGENFKNRGRRVEEQVTLLRRLWTESLVTFEGRWHTIPDAGLKPLPIQRPIPIWFGGHHENVLRRVATLGDGWMPNFRSATDTQPSLDQLDSFLAEAGRSRDDIGIEARLHYGDGNPDEWRRTMDDWEAAGATHFSINTMRFGFDGAKAHVGAIRKFAEAVLAD